MLQVSYEPLWKTLSARDMKKVDLKAIITPAALKTLQNHEPVSLNVLKLQRSFQPEAVRGAGRSSGEGRCVQANLMVVGFLLTDKHAPSCCVTARLVNQGCFTTH